MMDEQAVSLLARIVAASGADDELDYAITQHFYPGAARYSTAHQRFSGSIDAAVELVESQLPHLKSWQCGWGDRVLVNEMAFAIFDYRINPEQEAMLAATPALAMVAALLHHQAHSLQDSEV